MRFQHIIYFLIILNVLYFTVGQFRTLKLEGSGESVQRLDTWLGIDTCANWPFGTKPPTSFWPPEAWIGLYCVLCMHRAEWFGLYHEA